MLSSPGNLAYEKYQVLYTADAYRDLQGIHRYIAVELQEKTVAKKQMARIKKAILSLCALPERHGGVDWEPWSSMGVRRLPVDNYIVYYMVDQQKTLVYVIRVVYGGRDIEDMISTGQ